MMEVTEIARAYAHRCTWEKIPATARWYSPQQIHDSIA